MSNEAKKYDAGKADLSLIPTVAIEQMARAFMLGEKKYGRYNFYKGMEASRLTAAALRHIHAWNEGEELDPESGYSHLGHALACIAMILKQQELGTLKDNRYDKVQESPKVSLGPSDKVLSEFFSANVAADRTINYEGLK